MNKEIKGYTYALSVMGIINASLIVLSLNAIIVLNFPEYSGAWHIWNTFGLLVPLIPLMIATEKKGEKKGWKVILLAFTLLSVFMAQGNVAKTGWAISLLIFMLPALFAPRPGGKLLMTRPYVWHGSVFLISYGIGQISGSVSLMRLEVVVIYIFFVIWVLTININGCLKKIRGERGDVEVDSILRENRRGIIFFIILFTLLSLLLPFVIDNIKGEREETSVVYEWGEETEEEDEDSFYQPVVKDKGISKENEAFDLSLIGNILMWLFIAAVVGFLILEIAVVIMKIKDIDGRKEKHRDQFAEDFTIEAIMETEKQKKRKVKIFLSPEEKIRRLYKRTVEKKSKGDNLSVLSTKEIHEEILSFDSYEFSSVYEDVRYSEKEAKSEDYEKMKASLEKQKKSSK
ncbi:MAG: hypothetical protein ACI4SL_07445 [Candidatus Ornithospirochaeta sp.]